MAKIDELVIGPVNTPKDAFIAIGLFVRKLNEVIRALNTLLP